MNINILSLMSQLLQTDLTIEQQVIFKKLYEELQNLETTKNINITEEQYV